MVSAKLSKINGVDPNTYIDRNNDSHWVIQGDRRVSWTDDVPNDNPLTAVNGGISNRINCKFH